METWRRLELSQPQISFFRRHSGEDRLPDKVFGVDNLSDRADNGFSLVPVNTNFMELIYLFGFLWLI
jgi:hypothetical protein